MTNLEGINDIHDLVAAVELDNIIVNEERARRIQWTDEELVEQELPRTSNSLGFAAVGNTLHYRFRAVFTDERAEYVSDYTAVYSVQGEADLPTELTTEFAERVAFMAVYPFIRASIFGAASRLGQPIPVLGIVRQGEFESGEAMTEEQVREAFLDNRSERSTS